MRVKLSNLVRAPVMGPVILFTYSHSNALLFPPGAESSGNQWGKYIQFMSPLTNDLELTHHAVVLMFQQVTMVHVDTRVVLEAGDDANGFTRGNQYRVLSPLFIKGWWLTISVKNLKLHIMEMHGVVKIHHHG